MTDHRLANANLWQKVLQDTLIAIFSKYDLALVRLFLMIKNSDLIRDVSCFARFLSNK